MKPVTRIKALLADSANAQVLLFKPNSVKAKPCYPCCNYADAVHVDRCTWTCPKCGRDISLGYFLWYEATHQEEINDGHLYS